MKYYSFICFFFLIKRSFGFSANSFKSSLRSLQLTPNQQIYYDYLKDDETPIVICHGKAGTGKTMISTLHGLSELKRKKYDKIIITRPTVLVDADNFGALPGNINDKMSPLIQHICNFVGQEHGSSANLYNIVKENKIEIIPLEYIRGHNFISSYIIADEMQNSTNKQMKALLTRMGTTSKLVIMGDTEQSDLDNANGLSDFLLRYNSYTQLNDNAAFVKSIQMTTDDIMRSDIVKEVLNIYDHLAI